MRLRAVCTLQLLFWGSMLRFLLFTAYNFFNHHAYCKDPTLITEQVISKVTCDLYARSTNLESLSPIWSQIVATIFASHFRCVRYVFLEIGHDSYGCETWWVILRPKRISKVFKKNAVPAAKAFLETLRSNFGPETSFAVSSGNYQDSRPCTSGHDHIPLPLHLFRIGNLLWTR